MSPHSIFNWPDGDVTLRATHGTDSRDFRVHELFLSFVSPMFKYILTFITVPQRQHSRRH